MHSTFPWLGAARARHRLFLVLLALKLTKQHEVGGVTTSVWRHLFMYPPSSNPHRTGIYHLKGKIPTTHLLEVIPIHPVCLKQPENVKNV